MEKIEICRIDKNNWEEASEISVAPEQQDFVPDVLTSLAMAYIEPWDEKVDVFGIEYQGKIIGIFYLSYTPQSVDNYWFGGFQIDKAFQGKGLGKSSFLKAMKFIKKQYPLCQKLFLTVVSGNHRVIRFYERNGFIFTGKANSDGELIYGITI